MSDTSKITAGHLSRGAFVYLRQSSMTQVENNRESTDRQYKLAKWVEELGWKHEQVRIVDEDLGISAEGLKDRSGFTKMTAEVAFGRVGIIVGLEVSRLARNNADWYRLLDLCGVTDTLIGDLDGIYHPGSFNDRLVLGLKGTLSEAELHVLRNRLNGGIRNKAARGELRRGLPIGFVWGDDDGEIRFHPDEAVTGAIRAVFERFAEMGSARQVWLWFLSQGLKFPFRPHALADMRWEPPTYTKIHEVLSSPVYAGAYVYGKTRCERYVDEHGRVRKRVRPRPRSEWSVCIRGHHQGFIDWETFESNQKRLAGNTRPRPHQTGGAVREGAALLQGIAKCGRCGRGLRVAYDGKHSTPAYYCSGMHLVNGRGHWCLRVGGRQIEQAVTSVFLKALTPAGTEASLRAAESLEGEHDLALAQFGRQVERAKYEAQRAERRYRAVDPDNRLVARGLEAEWEKCLRDVAAAEAELSLRQAQRPRALTEEERNSILAMGTDLQRVWSSPCTSDRDRKELLRTLIDEVIVAVDREKERGHLTVRWRGGILSEIDVSLPRSHPAAIRSDEETIELVRRLAKHYPDSMIAGILNRQGRRTATGLRFTVTHVYNLRRYWKIPDFEPPSRPLAGDLVTIERAAEIAGIAQSTMHRWVNCGFVAGEQLTPGAPWRIRVNDEFRSRFVQEAPAGYVPMVDAMRILGVSRQTILQRVKRGELGAVHVSQGRRKGLRIQVPASLPGLFAEKS